LILKYLENWLCLLPLIVTKLKFIWDILCFWARLYEAEMRDQKIVVTIVKTPPPAYRNFSSLCTLNVTVAINCTSSASQRYSVTHAPFLRDDSTTVGSSSWIVLYLLWINSWRGTAPIFVTGKHREIKILSVLLSRLIYMYMYIHKSSFYFEDFMMWWYNVYWDSHMKRKIQYVNIDYLQ